VKNRMFFPQPPMDGFTGGPENTLFDRGAARTDLNRS
jgi:hypothetical protein